MKTRTIIRNAVFAAAAAGATVATVGLFASPAMASTTNFPSQGQGFSLYNNHGSARGTITGSQFGQFGQFGEFGQYGQYGHGSVTVSGRVSNYSFGRFGSFGYRHGVTEDVFLSANSSQRGELIGSAGPGQSDRFSGSLYNTNSGTITLCAANQWGGGNVRDCTSTSFTVNHQHFNHHNH
jgi:hypothetical protein